MGDAGWEGAAQGAAGGAMAGAAFGPWGAAIGGVAGGLIGGISGMNQGGSYEDQLKALYERYANMPTPQAGPASQGSISAYRRNQAALVSQLEAMSRGEGPSAAQMQMREAMDRAAGAQASAAAGAGGRGVNSGAAYRNASNNTAAIQAQGARDTATIRAQEQYNATGMLGGVLAQGRAADESMSQFNAQAQNTVSLANLQAELGKMGITTSAQLQSLLAAMGAAGPGMGTQIMAGGAQAMPILLNRQQTPQPQSAPAPAPTPQGPVTQPSQTGMFGQYQRPYE